MGEVPEQAQNAGSKSSQVQIGVVNFGITTADATNIAREQAFKIVNEYFVESEKVAQPRIENLIAKTVERLAKDGRLGAMVDPAFMLTMRKAQISAGTTERDADASLLSELLAKRATDDSRPSRAAIDRAVEVVGTVDSRALLSLTASLLVTQIAPTDGSDPKVYLDLVGDVVRRVTGDHNLPGGSGWLDHSELLSLVRMTPHGLSSLKKYEDILIANVPSWFSSALSFDEVENINSRATTIGFQLPFLPQTLAREPAPVFRIGFNNATNLNESLEGAQLDEPQRQQIHALVNEKGLLSSAMLSYRTAFSNEIAARPDAAKLVDWWNDIPVAFVLTATGRLIAQANLDLCWPDHPQFTNDDDFA